jgi:hypothetical protein
MYSNCDPDYGSVIQCAAEAGSWGWGPFWNPEENEYLQLEATNKQRSEDCDWEH